MEDNLRACKRCELTALNEDELTLFQPDPTSKYGRRNLCISCHKTQLKEDRHKVRIPRTKNVFKSKRDKRLFHTFGIREVDYERMNAEQNGKCKICGAKGESERNTSRYKRLAVDHCHDTGDIRGLLCMKCNLGIGNFQDNIIYLENAINYLKER